jgi:hypothetical protein
MRLCVGKLELRRHHAHDPRGRVVHEKAASQDVRLNYRSHAVTSND